VSLATITSKGQTTIPKEIREHLKLHPGDRIDFIIEKEGRVVLEPATIDVRELEGALRKTGRKAVSVEDMNQAVKKRFRKKK